MQRMNSEIIILPRQTNIDVILVACGSLDSLVEMALLNQMSITDDIDAGTSLVVPGITDQRTVDYFTGSKHLPVTNISSVSLGGIGYMEIGKDFKVS